MSAAAVTSSSIADIAGDREAAPPAVLAIASRVASAAAGVEIDAGDLRAGTREGERNGAADPGARAGDDRILAGSERIHRIAHARPPRAARPR